MWVWNIVEWYWQRITEISHHGYLFHCHCVHQNSHMFGPEIESKAWRGFWRWKLMWIILKGPDYILITNLMHWLLFIHKILFSFTCFEPQVLIFRRIQLYTCIIWYCHSLWEFLVACRYTAWVRTQIIISASIWYLIYEYSLKYLFWFSPQRFSDTCLILRRNERDMIKNVYWSSCEVPVIPDRFWWSSNFLNRISEKIPKCQILWKSVQWETNFFMRTDRHI